MNKKSLGLNNDHAIWFVIAFVFLCVLFVLLAVFNHEREKPESPQAMVAAALNQTVQEWKPGMGSKPFIYHPAGFAQEWKPGMGSKPFIYHPAGFNDLIWKPLPRHLTQSGQR